MKTKRSSLNRLAVVSVLLLFLILPSVLVVWAAEVGIDSFATTYQNLTYTIQSGDTFPLQRSSFASASEALGGHRDLCLTFDAGNVNASGQVLADDTNDYLQMALSPSVKAHAVVQWDGTDATCTIDPAGMSAVDLTDGGSNAGVVIQVANSDGIAVDIKVTIWTDSSNYRQSTVQFKSAVATGQRVDLFMPWSSFTVGSGTLDPASVRAVELELDATVGDDGADMTIRMVKADSVYEYGDLPSSYLTANILQAYHIPKGLRLGNSCDADVTYNASDGADGDDLDQADDEDGVAPYGLPWGTDDWGTVRLRTIGCLDETNGCYVNGWIDWNNDGDFADTDVGGATERIIYRSNVFNGTYNYGFTTPTNWSNNWYYARFRICKTATACDTPTTSDTNVDDGEIEDYRWWLGPTGVDLASFTALGGNGVVSLDWATTNENDLVGFNLWRNTDASSPDTQLNVTLIEAKNAGTPFGSSYSYQDSGVVNGTTYYYWLESVEVGDVRTWHGPASAMPQFRFYLPLVWRQ